MKRIRCAWCNKEFKRLIGKINWNKKVGRKNYCSKKCRNKAHSKNISGEKHPNWKGGPQIIKCANCRKIFKRSLKQTNFNKKFNLKNYCSKECGDKAKSGKKRPNVSGENHWNWKNGITPENELERASEKNKQFTQDILKHDNYTCQICELTSSDKYPDTKFFRKYNCVGKWVKLEIDHIKPFSQFRDLRYNLYNVRILCKPCHKEYGARPQSNKWATSPIQRPIF